MILQIGKGSTVARTVAAFKKSNLLVRRATSLTQYNSSAENYRDDRQTCGQFKLMKNSIFMCQRFSSNDNSPSGIDRLTFNNICSETLDSLSEYFEELAESIPHLKNVDVTYSDGVLTVHFGQKYGTYVINRQTPNLQIWLSSPTSGPKRYDFFKGTWVYKHDQTTLHSLLNREIKEIANQEVDFEERCLHAKLET